ncbi:hypothetical protein O53_4004 [Microcystis aeruginosa TAIHU98]|uniref:Uncharacterized protein n=2 Tax=Microcystis aeruginosa TaxID=1126 RepID=L7E6U0_MICAE|nr:hypothetical protein O53_4004 [Microcystis aeruginosa TAIHU98]ODV38056.1 hypothetical protein BFG60_2388 [Microcystis aeruginosa NIES-98]
MKAIVDTTPYFPLPTPPFPHFPTPYTPHPTPHTLPPGKTFCRKPYLAVPDKSAYRSQEINLARGLWKKFQKPLDKSSGLCVI